MQIDLFSKFKQSYFYYIIYGILGYIIFLYFPIFNHQLTNWDDGLYVVYNPWLRNLTFWGIKGMFTSYYAGNYHPLTMLSMAMDYKIGGTEPWPYLFTNLLLHTLNTFLVYKFILKLFTLNDTFCGNHKYQIALITATLFGIHTFHVESVAWVSERKNVLYTFFFFLSLIYYCSYIKKQGLKFYFLSILFFLLSLLSKGTAVTLSPCLFCIDYFNNRELLSRKIILEKIPFFILSLIFGIVAVFAQESGDAIRENGHLFYIERIAVAGYGFLQYIIKLLYPYQLATYYPYPVKPGELLPAIFYISAALSLIVVGVYYFLYRKNKIMIFGALFFLANISIVLQLLPVGDAIMADRYVYIPSIGFFLIIAYSFYNLLLNNSKIKYYLWVAFIGYAIILSIKTKNQIKIWENSLTLWEDAIKKYPNNNDRGYLNRGNIYYDRGEYSIAENDYNKVLEIDSLNNGALIGMGLISQANLELKKSLRYFDKAIQKEKTYEGFMNRAALKICFPDYEGALSDLKEAFKINPYRTGVFNNRGVIFLNTGKYTEALENFNHALILDPESYHALLGIGRVNQALGNPNEALDALNKALLTKQTYEAYSIRADIKMLLRDFNGAREDFYNAMTINPLNAEAYISRGILEISTGNVDLAFQYYDKAIELNPNNSQAYMYRGIAKIDNGDFKGAVCDLDISLQLSYNSISLYYRGLAHAKAGFKNKACSDFNKSFEMGNAQAKIELDKFCGK